VRLDLAAARRAWESYRGVGAGTRAFLAARLAVAPLGPLDPELRELRGRVLSVGCGHGIIERYLAEINPDVTVEGVDLDPQRVGVAQATEGRCPRVTVRHGDATRLEENGLFDAAIAVDFLHHLPAEQHRQIAAVLERSLRDGGLCLVKEIATTPRWQHAWNWAHDRIVAGEDPITCRSPEELVALLEEPGLELAARRRISRLSPYPHYVVRLRKGAREPAS
jgi:cyclopropane fatty-acyl-phospholipid synthase-like methyltransferase